MKLKLKEILEEKTIDLLTKSEEEVQEQIRKDFKYGGVRYREGHLDIECPRRENEKEFDEKVIPYNSFFFAGSVLERIKEKDKKYYNQLYRSIKKNKGEADIDLEKVLSIEPHIIEMYIITQALAGMTISPAMRIEFKS